MTTVPFIDLKPGMTINVRRPEYPRMVRTITKTMVKRMRGVATGYLYWTPAYDAYLGKNDCGYSSAGLTQIFEVA